MHLEFYIRLGFDTNNVTEAAIKAAYRRLVKECHPDQHPNDAEKAAIFIKLGEAYEVLGDAEKRRVYDETGTVNQNEAANLKAQSIQKLIVTFMNVFNQIPIEVMHQADFKTSMHLTVDGEISQHQNQKRSINMDVMKLEKVKKRIKHKGTDDILATAISNRIISANAALKIIEDHVTILKMTKELIDEYDYDQVMEEQNFFNPVGNGSFRINFQGF